MEDLILGIPATLITYFSLSFIISCIIAALSHVISPMLVPIYKTFAQDKKKLWHTTTVSLIATCLISVYIFDELPEWIEYFRETGAGPYVELMNKKPSTVLLQTTGISLGYLTFDAVAMIIWRQDLIKALRKSLYDQMMFHHLASLLAWTYCLTNHCCTFYVMICLVTEFSSIFLNLRSLLQFADNMGSFHNAVGYLLLISYTIIRILPIPFIVYAFAFSSYEKWSLVAKIMGTIFVPAPIILNLFWYYLMMRKGLRMIKELWFPKSKSK